MCLKIVWRARQQQYQEERFKTVPLTVSQSGSDLSGTAMWKPPARRQSWLHEDIARLQPCTEDRDSNSEEQNWSPHWPKLLDVAHIRLDNFELREHLTLSSTTSFRDVHSTHSSRDSSPDTPGPRPAQNNHFSMEDFPKDPLSSPKISALPLAIRRTSMPDVTPFAQFCKMAPPSPSLESSRSNSLDNMKIAIPTISERSSCDLEVVPSELSESGSVTEPQLTTMRQAAFEKEPSQILRGQGTGFEILRPGSLNPETGGGWKMERRRTGPPMPLQGNMRSRARNLISRLFH